MKYYSEVLDSIFATTEELEANEKHYYEVREAERKAEEERKEEAARKKKEAEKKKKDESIRLDNLYTHAIELRKEYLRALREYESAVTNFVELYGSEHDKSLCSIINEIFS